MSETPEVEWLTVPDLTEILGLKVSQVRRLIEDRALLARKIDGVWKVPELFVENGEPLGELRGTLVVLADSGFSDDEAMDWLLGVEDSLGATPIDALRHGSAGALELNEQTRIVFGGLPARQQHFDRRLG